LVITGGILLQNRRISLGDEDRSLGVLKGPASGSRIDQQLPRARLDPDHRPLMNRLPGDRRDGGVSDRSDEKAGRTGRIAEGHAQTEDARRGSLRPDMGVAERDENPVGTVLDGGAAKGRLRQETDGEKEKPPSWDESPHRMTLALPQRRFKTIAKKSGLNQ